MLCLAAPSLSPSLAFILSVAYFRSVTLHLVFSRERLRLTDCRGSIVSGPGTLTPGRHVLILASESRIHGHEGY